MPPSIDQVKKRLAERVRSARTGLGLSQEVFADSSGIDRTYASQIERGIANPSLDVLCRVCKALDLELEDLFRSSSK
jgi:transcriptional regulator with XRE-family HTH domain